MKTYAEREIFDVAMIPLLRLAEILVGRVSDRHGNELRCHELARAAHIVLRERLPADWQADDLILVDGKCGPIEHSWVCVRYTPIGVTDYLWRYVVLDVYVPGRLPSVQLVDPLAGRYQIGDQRQDIDHEFVQKLVNEMRFGFLTRSWTTK